ncbi:MAG: hypothetical protein AUK58_00905 [Candidatus Moranbacteria bacterium CG2_30_41_165]|nr:MAG: hypothetical protein AUK58_00905 [Candidatus Moranbacteria bacterium CG2_30_41_165]PJC00371.1 MAG: hypothetical protein CO075_01005 [Candidatus Moranbacteria bacterium CG_4_9_14_0_8_um_filter_41_43]
MHNIWSFLTSRTKKQKRVIGIFLLIFFLGIFLRTYHFHDWLMIREDQSRDASLVSRIVQGGEKWPLIGPFMSYSGEGAHSEENAFHIGPIYYYFQILSAKVFGDYPDKLAYPDVFFGILTIPLLFFFLRNYFTRSISLGVTSLFAFSAYFVQYARFAWNTNLIPFFVLLFLFSLHRLLGKSEKDRWVPALVFGFSFGVGIQLHVITMAIFFITSFCVVLFLLKNQSLRWKEWTLIFLLVCFLNTAQIVSELQTNFSNTKTLLISTSKNNPRSLGTLVRNDLNCHMEAYAYFLSSYGGNRCAYNLFDISTYRINKNPLESVVSLVTLIFSLFGSLFLFRYVRDEKEREKKYFLYLVIVYTSIAFFVMLPLSRSHLSDFRYFTSTFFVPFLFLGFLLQCITRRFPGMIRGIFIFGIFLFPLYFSHYQVLYGQFSSLQLKKQTCASHFTTLGELEPVASYIAGNTTGFKEVYVRGDKDLHVIFFPMQYLLGKYGIQAIEMKSTLEVPDKSVPAYLISCRVGWRSQYPYQSIDRFSIFQINSER